MLHLKKLSVGSESVATLRDWQRRRLVAEGRLVHWTRQRPRRGEELLDGGSIYWVVKGEMRVRQRLLALDEGRDPDGVPHCGLVLDPLLVEVEPLASRPFQGWRYLAPDAAPRDLPSPPEDAPDMPAALVRELRALGLL